MIALSNACSKQHQWIQKALYANVSYISVDSRIHAGLRMRYLRVCLETALHLQDEKPCHEDAIYTSNGQVP